MVSRSLGGPGPYIHPCHICGSEDAPWGFTFPIAPQGQEFWACNEHRAELETMLAARPGHMPTPEPELPLRPNGAQAA